MVSFPSIELSHEWNVRSNECLHKVPSTHMDGLLRHIHWTKGELGNAFGKLVRALLHLLQWSAKRTI